MAETTRKSKKSRSRTSRAKVADQNQATAKATPTVTSQPKEDYQITHRTSSKPTDKKISTKLKQSAGQAKRLIARKTVWTSVGVAAIAILLILTLWWQWQRSYVAVVNGQLVPTSELTSQAVINSGAQLLPKLTQQYLIEQEAQNKNITINPEAVQLKLDDLIDDMGGQGQYQDALEQYGIPEDYLVRQIRTELIMDQLTKDKIKASDEEVKQRYEENKDTYDPDGTRGYENIKELIRTEIEQQKKEQEYTNIVNTLEEKSKVSNHLGNANLTFGQFFQNEVASIPQQVIDLFQSIIK